MAGLDDGLRGAGAGFAPGGGPRGPRAVRGGDALRERHAGRGPPAAAASPARAEAERYVFSTSKLERIFLVILNTLI